MMSDIAKCSGTGCPFKGNCYRYLAVSFAECQAYIDTPFDAKKRKCSMFWDVATERRKKMLLGLTETAMQCDNVNRSTQITNEQRNEQEGA